MANDLVIPDAARRDASATEVARVWIAEKGLHCSLRIGMYAKHPSIREEAAWGMMLADMARHVADALVKSGTSYDRDLALAKIQQAFEEELARPTTATTGGFSKPDN